MIYTLIAHPTSPERAMESGNALRTLVPKLRLDWSIGLIDDTRMGITRLTFPDIYAEAVMSQLDYMTNSAQSVKPYTHTLPFDNTFANQRFGRTARLLLLPTAHATVLDGAVLHDMESAWLTCLYTNKTAMAYMRSTAGDSTSLNAHERGWHVIENPSLWQVWRYRIVAPSYTNHVSLVPVEVSGMGDPQEPAMEEREEEREEDSDPQFTNLEEVLHG